MTDDEIVSEAKSRFHRCEDWESQARKLWLDDYKFAHADSDNGYQWPNNIKRDRDVDARPSLTINKTRQHCLQIVNDARQNKPEIKVTGTGAGASYQSAQVYQGIIRHIEYISQAQAAYDTASTFQVFSGIGYWRIVTDFPNDKTFDQEIYIRRVKDPLGVYLDCDITEKDGSDARYAFVFEDRAREQMEIEYPKLKNAAPTGSIGESSSWHGSDKVRVCEYYRKRDKASKLIASADGTIIRSDGVPKELLKQILSDPAAKQRDIVEPEVEWYLIVGDEIVERRTWPGRYIPIVRVIGEETVIDGVLDRKGHARALKNPQRMYNYWSSSAVEFVALQGKTPWVASQRATEGFEREWKNANRENLAWLPWNDIDDAGNPVTPPNKTPAPTMAPAYLQGLQVASTEMQMVSGQYDSMIGEQTNERAGVAIMQRQRQGEKATYHYIDNLAEAVRFTGRILIDLIPKIYDTPRVLRIMSDAGDESEIQIDPSAQQAYAERQQRDQARVERIFNPSVGEYEVISDIGPNYATRRQEAFNALTQMVTQAPALMSIAGDLIMKAADFPLADQLAERLHNMVPPQALGGPNPETLQLQQQLQQMQAAMETLVQSLADEKSKRVSVEQQKAIDVYKALTDRMETLKNVDPNALLPALRPLIAEAVHTHLSTVTGAGVPVLDQAASAPKVDLDGSGQQPAIPS